MWSPPGETAASCPGLRGGVDVGQRTHDHLAEMRSRWSRQRRGALAQDPLELPGGLLREILPLSGSTRVRRRTAIKLTLWRSCASSELMGFLG